MRRLVIIASVILAVGAIGVGGVIFAINRAIESLSGPVHHFRLPPGETFLTDDRAAAIGRDVMNRDGFPESVWKLVTDDRSKAPDGRPDRFLVRNTVHSNRGTVCFYNPRSRTPQRFVGMELHEGEITAQGTLGK